MWWSIVRVWCYSNASIIFTLDWYQSIGVVSCSHKLRVYIWWELDTRRISGTGVSWLTDPISRTGHTDTPGLSAVLRGNTIVLRVLIPEVTYNWLDSEHLACRTMLCLLVLIPANRGTDYVPYRLATNLAWIDLHHHGKSFTPSLQARPVLALQAYLETIYVRCEACWGTNLLLLPLHIYAKSCSSFTSLRISGWGMHFTPSSCIWRFWWPHNCLVTNFAASSSVFPTYIFSAVYMQMATDSILTGGWHAPRLLLGGLYHSYWRLYR